MLQVDIGNCIENSKENFIVVWIKQAIEEMTAGSESGSISLSPLKRLQRRLENSQSVDLSEENRFLVFFLAIFIQDVFYNLAGDVPYSENSEQEKQKFYSKLVGDLEQLSDAINQADSSKKLNTCMQLVNNYLDGVKSINLVQEEN
jgi:hypothetical protein